MRNQKEINVAKFERLFWRQEREGNFCGTAYISRKPFGEFSVSFKICSHNGETSVEVRNLDFPNLNWGKSCIDYKYAVESVKQRFDEIDELTRNIPREVQKAAQDKAKSEYLKLISTAVRLALLRKEETKGA